MNVDRGHSFSDDSRVLAGGIPDGTQIAAPRGKLEQESTELLVRKLISKVQHAKIFTDRARCRREFVEN